MKESDFGYPDESAEKWVKDKSNKAFHHFFAIYNDISKFHSTFSVLHFEKSSNLAKNEEKPCSTCH